MSTSLAYKNKRISFINTKHNKSCLFLIGIQQYIHQNVYLLKLIAKKLKQNINIHFYSVSSELLLNYNVWRFLDITLLKQLINSFLNALFVRELLSIYVVLTRNYKIIIILFVGHLQITTISWHNNLVKQKTKLK